MNQATMKNLWRKLDQAGLVNGEIPDHEPMESPWYVRAMLGISGWIGALFLLGFVGIGMMFILENAAASLTVGVICCVGSMMIFNSNRRNDFASQFGLAISLAGQAIFVAGLFQIFEDINITAWLLIAIFETVLIFIMHNSLHRMWSTWAAVTALFYALADFGIHVLLDGLVALAMAYIWLNEYHLARHSRILKPVGYGLTINLIQFSASPFLYTHLGLAANAHGDPAVSMPLHWIDIAIMSMVFFGTVWFLLKRENIDLLSRVGRAAFLLALLALLLSLYAPGLSAGLLILLLGFANGNRILLGIGLISLATYLSWYYYSLHATLLSKSIVLVATGLVLIVLRWVLIFYFRSTGAENA